MRVDYHCHSCFSRREKVVVEGLNTPKEIVEHARKLRLGAVGITDHDSIEGSLIAKRLEKKYGVVVITAEEVSTRSGHVLALGINEWIKPDMTVEDTVDAVHDQGGVAVAPHPFDIYNEGIKDKAVLCDAMEGFNALNLDRISNKKASRFGARNMMTMLAGSDAHCVEMMNHGVISVKAEDMDGVLNAIRKGRFAVSKSKYIPMKIIKDWSARRLKFSYDEVLSYINENYSWPKRVVSSRLLSLVNMYPGRIDYLFRGIAYASLGATITYSAMREVVGISKSIY
ncbi:MAG: PHP domain-containing protein [Candidatus Aenigmarchaeota archaeon]|nr:PHP domain-containing protein [Candidatus Aenigmarchaeota archaeon]